MRVKSVHPELVRKPHGGRNADWRVIVRSQLPRYVASDKASVWQSMTLVVTWN